MLNMKVHCKTTGHLGAADAGSGGARCSGEPGSFEAGAAVNAGKYESAPMACVIATCPSNDTRRMPVSMVSEAC